MDSVAHRSWERTASAAVSATLTPVVVHFDYHGDSFVATASPALSNARRQVDALYAVMREHEHDAVMREHDEARDCYACEDFLQMGIDAFGWLCRADEVWRSRFYANDGSYDPKVQESLEKLFRGWMVPCGKALKWAESVKGNGFEISNLEKFTDCYGQAVAIVKNLDSHSDDSGGMMNPQILSLEDEAIREHSDGETAEFF